MSIPTSFGSNILTLRDSRLPVQNTCECASFTEVKLIKPVHSINHAETTVVFASSNHVQFLLKLAPSVPKLRLVVILDEVPVESKDILVAWGKDKNVQVLSLRDCMCMTTDTAIRSRIDQTPGPNSGSDGCSRSR